MLPSGESLGPYQALVPIGAGGMGEVYKAHDPRLGRDVALKVLPPAATSSPDRLRRFEQEARAAAALNHPNILAIFDVGHDRGLNYVVAELLDGETLRERLNGGPIPRRKAIEWATQVAKGLAAAHEKGIVHRDIKPENLFITRDGRVKILDFGIAKLIEPDADDARKTTIDAGTGAGAIVGTVGYMSPEQVRSLPVDRRSDIFAFGAVLYEMLAGRRAFAGTTHADTMTAVLSTDPPEFDPAAEVPPVLDRIVRRCLEKRVDERFQSAQDLAFALDAITTAQTTGTRAVESAGQPRRHAGRMSAAALILLVAAIATSGAWVLTRRQPQAAVQYKQITFRRGTVWSARFSADGNTIVYSASWEGRPAEIFSTRPDGAGERALGIHGDILSVSRDGELAVLLNPNAVDGWAVAGTLARVGLAGGAPRELLRDVVAADWSPDGQTLAIVRFVPDTKKYRLEFPIGTVIYETNNWIESPRLSRDGARIALIEHTNGSDTRGSVLVISRAGARAAVSPEYPSVIGLSWSPKGDEVWFTAAGVGARTELLGARPGGGVRPVAPAPAAVVLSDVAPDGSALMQTVTQKARLLVKTANDTAERDAGWLDWPSLSDLSADGRLLLINETGEGGGPQASVFVRPTDGSPAIRIGAGFGVSLSPDRQWAITGLASDPPNAFTITPVGPGESRQVKVAVEELNYVGWFPDGKRLMVVANEKGRPRRTFEFRIGGGSTHPITPEGVTGLGVAPDGRSLIAQNSERVTVVWPLDGNQPRPLPGLVPGERVVAWAADGRGVFTSAARSDRLREIARLDIATGRRQVIAMFGPSDLAGVRNISDAFVSADGRTYAYRYNQILSDLFLARGLR